MEEQVQSTQYIRINSDMVHTHKGNQVSVVGNFMSFGNGILKLKVDDGVVFIADIEEFPETPNPLEIRGHLNSDGQIEAKEFSELSLDFDLPLYSKVVQLMHGQQFKELFYN